MTQRNARGRFVQKRMTFTDRMIVMGLACFTISIGWTIDHYTNTLAVASDQSGGQPAVQSEIVSSSSGLADDASTAGEALTTPAPTATPSAKTQKQKILMLAVEIFGDKADEAIQIMKCESGYRADNHGDKHLMSINAQTGEEIGDSIGLFQIRTGDTNWNRAKQNGMTADEFRAAMKDPEKNMRYAKKLYDAQGWKPWLNCKNKLGL